MRTQQPAIEAESVRKTYGDKAALDDFSLTVAPGTVLGLLGPNGAGKTTFVRILTTLSRMDGGSARVGGFDVQRERREVRSRIGLTGQRTALDEILTARENLRMFGRLFHLSKREAAVRADELLEQFSLTEAADQQAKSFSGGMQRRLDLASSMILAPQVLFLDEPTTGLDPRGRREVWDAVRTLAAGGTTVLLTTHYLDEADRLSDRIAVIDRGRAVVEDTPAGLKNMIGGDRLEVVVQDPDDLPRTTALLASATGDPDPRQDVDALRVHAAVTDRVSAVGNVIRAAEAEGIAIEDIGLRQPTLDEVFLRLTGRTAQEDSPAADPARTQEEVLS
ncbi:ATP-binding cassette domain-containing protein [Luteipulveratus halotolerans]|uniref:ABC transporter n=1 Tax=Luteipulveratus halotolerans TaxID=1631356 RepID=A0A0L6CKZ3_9MICO|nr:ATP-binding cassette domain-containing protein [Luteipulveratus halotolerans]KNX38310.1 ABC transporter [Luteipulveratus halotolerans]